ncbi:MAG: hypothetical protein PHY56_00545 [Candidatus Omnitrophica bacterium]|nr:hypothetical protein [Candidatus Omnitrophota bacterium]
MKDIEENLFLQDIKESGLKAEEGCYCQVCRILRQINKAQQGMADRVKVIADRVDKEISNAFGLQANLISNSYPGITDQDRLGYSKEISPEIINRCKIKLDAIG